MAEKNLTNLSREELGVVIRRLGNALATFQACEMYLTTKKGLAFPGYNCARVLSAIKILDSASIGIEEAFTEIGQGKLKLESPIEEK